MEANTRIFRFVILDMVEDEDLDYNLGQRVLQTFWESSSKYETAKNVEPMVLTLRSFIEGNASLKCCSERCTRSRC